MKTCFLVGVVAAILVAPNASGSALPELLIPVTGQEEQQVREKQDYFLKKHNYFAKRHRIVRVNTDVLFDEPRFRITFFDDASISVRREELDCSGECPWFTWKGHMESQPISVEDFATEGEPPDLARETYSALVEVWISGSKNLYDPETGRSASLVARDGRTGRRINSVDRSKGQYEFYSVATDICPLSLSKTFILKSLEMDRRYHLVLEEDPTKRISPGTCRDGGPYNEADQAFRHLQYEQFLEFLGPDPRTVTNREE